MNSNLLLILLNIIIDDKTINYDIIKLLFLKTIE